MSSPYADLIPRSLSDQAERMIKEYESTRSIFFLREKDWYEPEPEEFDFSVRPFANTSDSDVVASTPFGPAAGPHTQMSQNLVLSWLVGSRIIELKTVQVLDDLTINRPCIHIPNIGFNIEWSQELRVHESLHEYVVGAMLIRILRELGPEWGHPAWKDEQTIFDMSVGYNLEGIRTEKVSGFIQSMMNAGKYVDSMRDQLKCCSVSRFRDLDYPERLSNSITLSTFHGCPPEEIEGICNYLLDEMGVHVCVKMNPTMLGRDEVKALLHDKMGYDHLVLNDSAFDAGLQYDDALDLCRRLQSKAIKLGLHFSAKFTNTLELKNTIGHMPDEVMYLSGAPLHVISSTLASRFRDDYFAKWGSDLSLSFSAGIEKANFADSIACGFLPLTACTDLLKTGGYRRAAAYLNELKKEFARTGALNISDYIQCRADEKNVVGDPARGFHASIIPALQDNPRYAIDKNKKEPPKIDSHLVLFDCLSCDKCIPVCPNAANFTFPSTPVTVETVDWVYDGKDVNSVPSGKFEILKEHQIANFFDWCNECGNCDTYCPEEGGPFIEKPTFFGSEEAFRHFADQPGAWIHRAGETIKCLFRWRGEEHAMIWTPGDNTALIETGPLTLEIDTSTHQMVKWLLIEDTPPDSEYRFAGEVYHTMLTLLKGAVKDKSELSLIV